jgi:hypothetical protein
MLIILFIFLVIILLIFYKKSIVEKIEGCEYLETDLCSIMKKYGSDKSTRHNYTCLYHDLFKDMKDRKLNIFEMGIGSKNSSIPHTMGTGDGTKVGGSLYAWRDYFTDSNVYSADIDKDVLFSEDKIHTYYVDQLSSEAIHNMWTEIGDDVIFDIIIDDGLHTPEANHTFALNSHHKLKPGGLYIIEDVDLRLEHEHLKCIDDYKRIFKFVKFVNLPHKDISDNNLIVMQK